MSKNKISRFFSYFSKNIDFLIFFKTIVRNIVTAKISDLTNFSFFEDVLKNYSESSKRIWEKIIG